MRSLVTFALAACLLAAAFGQALGQVPWMDNCTVDDDLQDYYIECFRTCPGGDTHTYDHFRITVRDFWNDPIPDIPAEEFSFVVQGGGDLSFSPMEGYAATNAEGVIEFSITANSGVAHPDCSPTSGEPLNIYVFVMGYQLTQHLYITCRTFDYNLDGTVDPVDFAIFAIHFGSDGTGAVACSDFNEDGEVHLFDFGMFAAHFGHEHLE